MSMLKYILLFLCLYVTIGYPFLEFPHFLKSSPYFYYKDIGIPERLRLFSFGDFNSDRSIDLVLVDQETSNVLIYSWNEYLGLYSHLGLTITLPAEAAFGLLVNIVPSDYNFDGLLDLLITVQVTSKSLFVNASPTYKHYIYLFNGASFESYIPLPDTFDELLLLDFFGTFHVSLLGIPMPNDSSMDGNPISLFSIDGNGRTSATSDIQSVDPAFNKQFSTKFSIPNSNAYLDLNGDCIPDIIITAIAEKPFTGSDGYQYKVGDNYIEIWNRSPLNREWVLGKHFYFPFKFSSCSLLAYQDISGTGSIDMAFIYQNDLYIFFNTQLNFCKDLSSTSEDECKSISKRNVFDPSYGFKFSLDTTNLHHTVIKGDSLSGKNSSFKFLLKDSFNQPIPIRFGDFDSDGYPDILVLYSTESNVWTTTGSKAAILLNTLCTNDICTPEQTKAGLRTFTFSYEINDYLSNIAGVTSCTFFDILGNGITDLILNVVNFTDNSIYTIPLMNNHVQDAFFLKMVTLNPLCFLQSHKSYGVNYPGISYKYAVMDINGVTNIHTTSQYYQTRGLTLMTPYVFIGLGRINTFVEFLDLGKVDPNLSINTEDICTWNSLIPNSNLFIFPPSTDHPNWYLELHLHPGKQFNWIVIAWIFSMVSMLVVVCILRKKEKNEDKREKRRNIHHINFEAF